MKILKRILIIVAHSDDESFGCGGLIKKLSLNKNKISAISFTNGIGSRSNYNVNEIKKRQKSSTEASKVLGFKWLAQYQYPDNQLDKISLLEIIKKIEKHKKQIKPHIVLTHNFSDLNIDHEKSLKPLTAFRPEQERNLSN